MKTDNWEKAKEIFGEALKLSPTERLSYLDEVCADDDDTRREVESLLASLDTADSFLLTPVGGEAAKVVKAEPKRLENGKCFGHYEIVRMLGVGGMGEVYLAQDKKLDRRVAIKILNEKFAKHESNLGRFTQEAKAASALNHPNILIIYEIGETEKTRYIVSEYIEGKTLRECFKESPMKLSAVLEIAIQIANALAAAHAARIVHRDIKPENIMVRPDGYVKILDFSLAKLIAQKKSFIGIEDAITIQNETAEGIILGTVNYMSPEQAQGAQVDGRTDIFSFGVVLYEMIARKPPFPGKTLWEIFTNLINSEPLPLAYYVPNAPDELQRIVSKMLKKITDERYQKMDDLLVELKSLQKHLDFAAELRRTSQLNKQLNIKTQIFEAKITESIPKISPTNLTEDLSLIIGREKEIVEIKNLLRQREVRLLTMTGIGGTGKTTLARAVVHELLEEFMDGIFFIELAAITNPELVSSTIAQPLGVKEKGGKPMAEVLKDYLRKRKMLLVLDNFEQITAAAPVISELLSAAPRLKILVTSRELLHLSNEREFGVPPLALPDETARRTLDDLSKCEAIRLFVQRAQNAKPNFTLTKENAVSVAEICIQLDGLPLAIELAAARVKILSPQAILAKLDNRLKLLIGGARDLPARQQTMRGTVEWSYELLNEVDKHFFCRLAIFVGGFIFEAAEAVCAKNESDKEQIEVLDMITSLVDKSLLVSKEHANGGVRFRMLEVVREFALEVLEASIDAEAMRCGHAAYFLALSEEAEPHLPGNESIKWLNHLEDEHDNLRAALQWSFENDVKTAVILTGALRRFWHIHGHLTESRRWLKAALEQSNQVPATARFKILNGLGQMARHQGDYKSARKLYEICLAEGKIADDKWQIGVASICLGTLACHEGDYPAARKFYEEGLVINRELDDKFYIAVSFNCLGDLARLEGDTATALLFHKESLEIARKLGSKESISAGLNNMGGSAFAEGNYKAAYACFAEALAIAWELEHKIQISYSLDGFAALATWRGESKLAAQLSGAAEQLRELIGYEIEPAERHARDIYLAELKTKMDEADFSVAYEQGCKLKLDEVVALCI